jgi:hypothetical protein
LLVEGDAVITLWTLAHRQLNSFARQSACNASLQLEAALFCLEQIARAVLNGQSEFLYQDQLKRIFLALPAKPPSLMANPLTREGLCRFVRKVSWNLAQGSESDGKCSHGMLSDGTYGQWPPIIRVVLNRKGSFTWLLLSFGPFSELQLDASRADRMSDLPVPLAPSKHVHRHRRHRRRHYEAKDDDDRRAAMGMQ